MRTHVLVQIFLYVLSPSIIDKINNNRCVWIGTQLRANFCLSCAHPQLLSVDCVSKQREM